MKDFVFFKYQWLFLEGYKILVTQEFSVAFNGMHFQNLYLKTEDTF